MFDTLRPSSRRTPIATNARDLAVEHVARQPILRDAEAHHAAGHRSRLEDRDVVAEPRR
jgi:hypothetical protein